MRSKYQFDSAGRNASMADGQPPSIIATDKNVGEDDGYIFCRFHDTAPAENFWVIEAKTNKKIKIIAATYLYEKGIKSSSSATRKKIIVNLRMFLKFVDDLSAEVGNEFERMDDLPTWTPSLFEQWLLKPNFNLDKNASLQDTTRRALYREFEIFILWCRSNKFSPLTSEWQEKPNPWKSCYQNLGDQRRSMTQERLDTIREACIKSIGETRKAILDGIQITENFDLTSIDLKNPKSFKDHRVGVKLAHQLWPSAFQKGSTPYDIHDVLNTAMYNRYTSRNIINRYLVITSEQLVPFILLMALDTLFNTSTLLGLKWRKVEFEDPIFGISRMTIRGTKARAFKTPKRSFDTDLEGDDHPAAILTFLREHAARTREYVSPEFHDDIFVYYSIKQKAHRTLSFHAGDISATWQASLDRYLTSVGLEQFSIQDLRTAGGEAVYKLTGGDLKAEQTILGHASAETTRRHYRWRAARAFGQEQLADIMARQVRLFTSNGKVDDRDGRLSEGGGSAATPGFTCLEPTRSPVPGQKAGQMCNAYGCCPACRNVAVNPRDAASLAKLRQLRDEINRARTRISPPRWMSEWRHQLAALEHVWIPAFDEKVSAEADDMTPRPIPVIE